MSRRALPFDSAAIVVRLAIIILVFASVSYSQTGWTWLHPLPQGNDLSAVQHISLDTIVAVGNYSTFIKSTSGGRNWAVQNGIGNTDTWLRGVKFIGSDTGYAVGWEGVILKTENGGDTWQRQSSGTWQNLFAVDFVDADHGFTVGASGTILYTSDGGATWVSQSGGTTAELRGVSFPAPGVASIVGRGVLRRTTNSGTTWVAQSFPSTGLPHNTLYAVDFIDANTGFAIGEAGVPIKTTNGGTTWVAQTSPISYYIYSISFSDANNGNAGGAIATTDGGATWILQAPLYSRWDAVSLFDPMHGIKVGYGGDIRQTSDGGWSWYEQYPRTIVKTPLFDVDFINADTGLTVSSDGIYRTIDGGRNWSSVGWAGTAVHFADAAFGTAVYGGTILRTTDGGLTWGAQSTGFQLEDVYFTSYENGILVGGDVLYNTVILRTTNTGISWSRVGPTAIPQVLKSVSFSKANPMLGLAVGEYGLILRTTTGGASWEELTAHPGMLHDLAFADSAVVVASLPITGKLIRSTDLGDTWVSVGPDSTVGSSYPRLAFEEGGVGVASGYGGTWRSTDQGLTWTKWRNVNQMVMGVAIGVTGGRRIVYSVGEKGSVSCAVLSPLIAKIWTGAVDTLWENGMNWSPIGAPSKGDSVVIPAETNQPVLGGVSAAFPIVASLTILSGAHLAITDSAYFVVVKGDVRVYGTLEVRPGARTLLTVGGTWYVQPAIPGASTATYSDGGFSPANSTVEFFGVGVVNGSFYNVTFDSVSQMTSSGNLYVERRCNVQNVLNIRAGDTLFANTVDASALNGPGLIPSGTIVRQIDSVPGGVYRFESDKTSLRFLSGTGIPSTMTVTTWPDSAADSAMATTMVRRYYELSGDSGAGFEARLSLRYDPAELPAGLSQKDLKILWRDTTAGMDIWRGVPSTVDTVKHLVVAERITHLSKWALGRPKVTSALAAIEVNARWNLISLPVDPENDSASAIFSGSYSGPYRFATEDGYAPVETLAPGSGYWMKFDAPASNPIGGMEVIADTVYLTVGWNLIGALSYPIAVTKVYSLTTSLSISSFYGYDEGYFPADTLQPGRGYWVKPDRAGRLVFSAFRSAEPQAGGVRIRETGELPPPPPDMDGSASGRIPQAFALGRNYPNPFNPVTTIRYDLPVRELVRLTVYNVLGQVVQKLVDGEVEAGYHAVTFDGSALPSGIYFYRLTARGFTDVKKMSLVK